MPMGLGPLFVNAYPYLHTVAAPNTITITRINQGFLLSGYGYIFDLGFQVFNRLSYKRIGCISVSIFHDLLFGCPGGVASATETVIHEPFYFVGFGFKVLCHHIVHKPVSMRFKKHSFTCRTVTLFAEVG